jgi:hypothetical protein
VGLQQVDDEEDAGRPEIDDDEPDLESKEAS